IAGIFVGGGDGGLRAMVDKKGNVSLRRWAGWPKDRHTLIWEWSTMTKAQSQALFEHDTPIIVIPGHPTPSTAKAEPEKADLDHQLDPNARPSETAPKGQGKGKSDTPELKGAKSGSEFSEKDGEAANHPAFPARIDVSKSIVVQRNYNELSMHLDLMYGANDLITAMWQRDTVVHYTWERWNVSGMPAFRSDATRDAAAASKGQ